MTTSNEAAKKTKAKTATSLPKHYKSMSALVVTTLLAIAGIIYFAQHTIQFKQDTMKQIQSLKTEIKTLQEEQKNTTTALKDTQGVITNAQEKLTNMDKEFQAALKEAKYQTKDWLLLKARYYLELAQINTHWSNDTETTIALLQEADALLAPFREQPVFNIRQVIAQEMTELKATPKVDTTGLLSQLDAIFNLINQIPLKRTTPSLEEKLKSPAPASMSTTTTSSVWQTRFKKSLDALEKLVVIRRQDDEYLPLPSKAYESMLRESIRLALQQAQWAVLQHDEAMYQFSLNQAMKLIQRSFATDAMQTKALLTQLQELQAIHLTQPKLHPECPSSSGANIGKDAREMSRYPRHNVCLWEKALPLLNQLIESKTVQSVKETDAGEPS
jgi:uroporphyrin-3 C-methyltransferase